jgi:hypothetical protein
MVYVCDVVTLSVSTPGKLKDLLDRGGNRIDSPMLCQLSYEVKSVGVHDISELKLVPLK